MSGLRPWGAPLMGQVIAPRKEAVHMKRPNWRLPRPKIHHEVDSKGVLRLRINLFGGLLAITLELNLRLLWNRITGKR